MRFLSGQLSWCPLQKDSMHISCADNPTFQWLEIRKMNLERALLPGPLCASLANDPTFKGMCVLSFYNGLRPRAFISEFFVFRNPDETLALVFEIVLKMLVFTSP